MTAKLVKDLLGIKINLDGILDLLICNEKECRVARDVYGEALDTIMEFINNNLPAIQNDDRPESYGESKKLIGKRCYDNKTGKTIVSITKSLIDNELVKKGFNDRAKILKKLADMGYILRDEDRLIRRVTIGFLRQTCYKFAFPYEFSRKIVEPTSTIELQTCEDSWNDENSIKEMFDESSN